MAYGHAERNLALIRQLEAETGQLLQSLPQQDGPGEQAFLAELGVDQPIDYTWNERRR
jgi:hypothetical protein